MLVSLQILSPFELLQYFYIYVFSFYPKQLSKEELKQFFKESIIQYSYNTLRRKCSI